MAGDERLICASDALLDGGVGVRFAIPRAKGLHPGFAVRFHGTVYAYVNECRHQQTELDWSPGEFFDASKLYLICATHGALYEPDNGLCVAGPCRGARLTPVTVRECDGGVYWVEP